MINLVICIALALFNPLINKNKTGEPVIKGKLVYKSCASLVIQITDSAYFNLGQQKWQRTPVDKEYEHVFLIKNNCVFLSTQIQRDEEFFFTIIRDDAVKNTCQQCMFHDYPPNIALSIIPQKKKE